MVERTEEAGLSGLLNLRVGGARVDVPVLNIEQSERWLRYLGELVQGTTIPTEMGGLFTVLGPRLTEAVVAYETLSVCPEMCPDRGVEPGAGHSHVGALGGSAGVTRRMNKRELRDAFEAMFLAENPFVTDLRSVVEASGPQIRQLLPLLVATVAERLVQVNWRPTPSENGGSTPPTSGDDSPANSSSSSGSTTSSDDSNTPGSSGT